MEITVNISNKINYIFIVFSMKTIVSKTYVTHCLNYKCLIILQLKLNFMV